MRATLIPTSGVPTRKLSLVLSSLVALLMAVLLLGYAPRYVSGQRIYLDDRAGMVAPESQLVTLDSLWRR
jgi:hypothetical protein